MLIRTRSPRDDTAVGPWVAADPASHPFHGAASASASAPGRTGPAPRRKGAAQRPRVEAASPREPSSGHLVVNPSRTLPDNHLRATSRGTCRAGSGSPGSLQDDPRRRVPPAPPPDGAGNGVSGGQSGRGTTPAAAGPLPWLAALASEIPAEQPPFMGATFRGHRAGAGHLERAFPGGSNSHPEKNRVR